MDELPTKSALPSDYVLVVTADRAFEIDQGVDDGQTLRGQVVRAWSVAGPVDVGYFDRTRDDPADVAEHLGWHELAILEWAPNAAGAPGTVAIAHADIKRMRVTERQYGQAIVGTVVILVIVLAVGVATLASGLSGTQD